MKILFPKIAIKTATINSVYEENMDLKNQLELLKLSETSKQFEKQRHI